MNIQNTVNMIKQGFLFNHSFIRDNDLAQMWLDDFESGASGEGHLLNIDSQYKVLFASEALKSKSYYKRSQLVKMKKEELYNLCEQFEILNYCYSYSNYADNVKDDLINELLLYVDNEKYYRTHFEESIWHDLDHDLQVNGYCQGDVIKFKFVESKTDKLEYKPSYDYLENLYFNSPIYCRITVYDLDGDEVDKLYIDEYTSDQYDFDKSDVLEIIKKHYSDKAYFNTLIEYVENNFSEDAKFI